MRERPGNHSVRPKKHLGQHFLVDQNAAERIAAIVSPSEAGQLIEIGPGTGVLTKLLYPVWGDKLICVEIDRESVNYLEKADWAVGLKLLNADFLKLRPSEIFTAQNPAVIGNYPYNISTQIAFQVLESPIPVSFFGGMFQMEVARRFCAPHGNKEYGVTSVLLQSWYQCEYIFTVEPDCFFPPPKVRSGVIACRRKAQGPACTYKSLSLVVKTAFNQRRKTLSNALKSLTSSKPGFQIPTEWVGLRAEQLSVAQFEELAVLWEKV
ncbi:MAG: ribosomal RNA small subunit methyltransferase A [Bacteroidia bacterium]|nr:ribosomal RNA small subunit methyltransferase A [Bacteroidia bacterium]